MGLSRLAVFNQQTVDPWCALTWQEAQSRLKAVKMREVGSLFPTYYGHKVVRYAADVRDAWLRLRGELTMILVIGGIFAAFIAASVYSQIGPAKDEYGEVVRFGSYAHDLGNRPTLIVRTVDGRQHELKASPESLRHCEVGGSVRLVRKAHSLRVDPRGCQ
ncbi:hypothetical protein [Sphingomonas lenta]|uniref:hypothetical protein n=1 Tax=Sphingomonas lenta TaxID=1141887 RepID=UPI0015961EF9|nr:hypothetical protein [Sphingomonas lenta]